MAGSIPIFFIIIDDEVCLGGAKEKGVDIDYNHKRNLLVIKQDMTMPDLPMLFRQKERMKKL